LKITSNTVGQLSLDDIVNSVPAIYEEKDKLRSVWDIWLHATHHASAIGEEVRKYRPGKKLLIEIADFSMWLFTFSGKIKGTFQDSEIKNRRISELTIKTDKIFSEIVWAKYPRVCPVCFWRRMQIGVEILGRCDCLIHNIEDRDVSETDEEKEKKKKEKRERVKALREYSKKQLARKNKPATIDEWQNMFGELYKANLQHLSLVDIAFHLLEEVGEVSDAMVRMYSYVGDFDSDPRMNQIWLEEEIADVYSWLNTLVNGLKIMPDISKEWMTYLGFPPKFLGDDQILLSKIIWYRYGNDDKKAFRCPSCKELKCKCDLLLVGENVPFKEFLHYTDKDPLVCSSSRKKK